MRKVLKTTNKGYSLVEMVIVVTIILILGAMSLVSLTLINSARAKQASVTFESEVEALKTKCMNMKPAGDNYDYYGISVYMDAKGVYNLCLVKHNKTNNKYEYIDDENQKLSSRVEVEFTGSARNISNSAATPFTLNKHKNTTKNSTDVSDTPIIISFDKRGNCFSGYGNYYFLKRNGSYMARVEIKQNGSIDIR